MNEKIKSKLLLILNILWFIFIFGILYLVIFGSIYLFTRPSEAEKQAGILLLNAEEQLAKGNPESAIESIIKALDLNKDGGASYSNGTVLHLLGKAQMEAGKLTEAKTTLDKAINQAYEYLNTYTFQSSDSSYQNEYLHDHLVQYYFTRADIYSKLGQHQLAEKDRKAANNLLNFKIDWHL